MTYEFSGRVLAAFEDIKNCCYRGQADFYLPVEMDGRPAARLYPLTRRHLEDTAENTRIVRLLGRWREEAAAWFDIFPVSEQGTRRWLKDQVIGMKNRLLFMLQTEEDGEIGHMGFYRGEVDNVIRGEKGVMKGLMHHALQAEIAWAFQELAVEVLYLKVFSENERAVALYRRCGFVEIEKIPLQRVEKPGSVRWEPMAAGAKEKPDRFFSLMRLRKPSGGRGKDVR